MILDPSCTIFVQQPQGSNLCGQAVVSMLLDIPLKEAMRLIGKKGKTNTKDVCKALGIKNRRLRTVSHHYRPENAIMRITWKNGSGHWVLKLGNSIFDPASMGPTGFDHYNDFVDSVEGRITSFLEL